MPQAQEAGKTYSRFHSHLSLDMKFAAPGRTFADRFRRGFQPVTLALWGRSDCYSFRSSQHRYITIRNMYLSRKKHRFTIETVLWFRYSRVGMESLRMTSFW